jgi:L-alanine-DL-glutamate epimerase-like enolase superfamily enzyme
MTRRELLKTFAAAPAIMRAAAARPTDVRIEDVKLSYEDHQYRAPYQFGGRIVAHVTLANVTCTVRTGDGRAARGRGTMPLGNQWAWPSSTLSHDDTLGGMKNLAEALVGVTTNYRESGHPIDIGVDLEAAYLKTAASLARDGQVPEPIPALAVLVVASPFDAAIHDAYGKAHRRSAYATYGRDLMRHDLSRYLGPDFKGEYPDRYLSAKPRPRTWLFHSIGGLDALEASDLKTRLNDGLPETLPEWIAYNGLRRLKVKLNGGDLAADVDRTVRIHRVADETQKRRGVDNWAYCLDFNERCPNVQYLLDYFAQVKKRAPGMLDRVEYVEQPTSRDLRTDRANVMHEANRIVPVLVDEGLTDLDTLRLAREMGYTGIALKACRGQTQSVLMASAAKKYGMFRTVQDLTCPGAALIHSAGIAAHVPGAAGLEANARQYVPSANRPWEDQFPGLFKIKDGELRNSELGGPGLGISKEERKTKKE